MSVFNFFDKSMGWLKNRTILLVRKGSVAYGTNIEGSDEDFGGICVPPVEYFLGFNNKFEQAELKAPNPDTTIYDIRKFFKLAAGANPNILDLLFCENSDVLMMTPAGSKIRENALAFLSKRVKFTFGGYAAGQMAKLKTGRELGKKHFNTEIGYNTKDAMHLVRLLRMCKEILSEGKCLVRRPDAKELLAIRAGIWSYDQLMEFVAGEEKDINALYESSNLPEVPDIKYLDGLCQEIIKGYIS